MRKMKIEKKNKDIHKEIYPSYFMERDTGDVDAFELISIKEVF